MASLFHICFASYVAFVYRPVWNLYTIEGGGNYEISTIKSTDASLLCALNLEFMWTSHYEKALLELCDPFL